MGGGISVEYKYEYYDGDYTCDVKNLVTTSEDRVITDIPSKHLSGKTNDDVTRFHAGDSTFKFLPQNITKYFKNIKKIEIRNAKIEKITKEDLMEFGDKLTHLNLADNDIEVLDADLFVFNRNLEFLSLSKNKIKKIDPKTFEGLENLNSLHLHNNPCTSENDFATNNRVEVLEIIKRVEAKCNDQILTAKFEEINSLSSNLKSTLETLNEKEKEIEKLKDINLKLEERVKKLKENEDLKAFMTEKYQELKNFFGAKISSLNMKSDMQTMVTEDLKKDFDEQRKNQKAFADSQEKAQKSNLEKFNKHQNEVKSLIHSQIIKVATLDAKIDKQGLKLSSESEKYFNDLKNNQEKILKSNKEEINDNLRNLTLKYQNEIKNQVQSQIKSLDVKIESNMTKISEDSLKAFNELKNIQKNLSQTQENFIKEQIEVKNLIEAQKTSLEDKIDNHVLKLTSDSEKSFDDLKNNHEKILNSTKEEINENLKNLTSKSTNEVKNLIEKETLKIDSKIDSKLDFNSKFKEINEKVEELQSKIEEDSKKNFDKFEKGHQKIEDNLKNQTEKLQENLKELKNLIDSQNAALNKNEEHQNETLRLAEKINQILSKIIEDTSEVSVNSKALKQEFIDVISALAHRVRTLITDLDRKSEALKHSNNS